ncbi:hypothetical protein GCM10010924_49090 [Rhizobium wenxiniae]|nr:hypothetical protein GCM10010924_49090 [Rhizobium wenxiniae]
MARLTLPIPEAVMKQISASKSFGGTQYVFSHASDACRGDMTFAVFMPPQAETPKCLCCGIFRA